VQEEYDLSLDEIEFVAEETLVDLRSVFGGDAS
jgi:hypothetical protein